MFRKNNLQLFRKRQPCPHPCTSRDAKRRLLVVCYPRAIQNGRRSWVSCRGRQPSSAVIVTRCSNTIVRTESGELCARIANDAGRTSERIITILPVLLDRKSCRKCRYSLFTRFRNLTRPDISSGGVVSVLHSSSPHDERKWRTRQRRGKNKAYFCSVCNSPIDGFRVGGG